MRFRDGLFRSFPSLNPKEYYTLHRAFRLDLNHRRARTRKWRPSVGPMLGRRRRILAQPHPSSGGVSSARSLQSCPVLRLLFMEAFDQQAIPAEEWPVAGVAGRGFISSGSQQDGPHRKGRIDRHDPDLCAGQDLLGRVLPSQLDAQPAWIQCLVNATDLYLYIFPNNLSYPQARRAIPCCIKPSVQLF